MALSGLDTTHLDPNVRPQDDLYFHVNGQWIADHVIAPDRAFDGTMRALHDEAEEQVLALIDEARAQTVAGVADPDTTKVGAMYASFMGTDAIEAAGLEPLAQDLAVIDAATGSDSLVTALGVLQRTGGVAAVEFFVDNDAHAPDQYVVYLTQAGLGLPDEAYYRDARYAHFLDAYAPHVARMLLLAGLADDQTAAQDKAARVVALERQLAAHHWDVVKDRDAELTDNPLTLAQLCGRAPQFDWATWVRALGAPQGSMDRLVVREPSYAEGFAALWATVPLADWQDWMRFHVVSSRASCLHEEMVEASFDFYGRTLTGAEEVRERWKRGVSAVEGVLGEAVGRMYVARHFPPGHKAAMEVLVANLVEAYRQSITSLDWLGEETKAKALAKLDTFTPKIGYPARWRDYSALELDPDDLMGNVRRANAWAQDFHLGKIGRPVDRDEWFMTPQTVNAYYNPGMNEIVFPAAILQPPFFDADRDDAANYGGIGAVIGHEIGHGFDDQGSKYDGTGALVNWWTADDRAKFEERTCALVAQYAQFSPRQLGGSHHVNGEHTIGENIGDLGGLTIALRAYEIALGAPVAEGPVVDGMTAAQRVFCSWAQAWRAKGRDEEVIRRLATDPHSPEEFRCNGVVSNIDEFAEAFDVQPGDGLWLDPDDRVRIW
ncbi:MAG: peptidase M13 [Micrococcales bacterium]|nr:peptidase M13 [Micrococcales bacterium]MCL2667185.1 peptidase M13 [Micrococcales bacterium]